MALNVLMTSVGRRVSLVEHFRDELRRLDPEGRIVAADLRPDAPARFVADEWAPVPPVTSGEYVESLLGLCERFEAELVVPLIDTELPVLAENRERFAARGVRLLVSDPATVAIGGEKFATHRFFRENGFDTPALLDAARLLAEEGEELSRPVIVKPARGSSSEGVFVARTRRELEFFVGYVAEPMVQELVAGDEHTLDVLADFQGRVRCVVPRKRLATRAGEVSKGVTVKDRRIIERGAAVVEALPGALGCITVQCFLTPGGDIRFIEINPRFGGGYPLSYRAGANYPRWLLEMHLGRAPAISRDGWQDGLAMLRYDEAVFRSAAEIA